ncbi:MAG: hypothetical protein AAGE52_10475 [Myxococcota bacterium]
MMMRDTSPPRGSDSGTADGWDVDIVSDTNAGESVRLTIADGSPVVAYYASVGRDDGPCDEVAAPGEEPPIRVQWAAYLAERSGRSWTETQVTEVLSLLTPQGLDLEAQGGNVQLAALTGGAFAMGLQVLCSAHDLGLYETNGDAETLVVNSGDAPVDAASDAGFVVGHWPALATSAGGQSIVAYRDIHFGGLQSDDERRADLEAVIGSPGSWRAVPVDPGRGAGRFNDAIFDADGNPYIAYINDFEFDANSRGTLVARSMDDGDTWEIARLNEESTERGPSIWLDADNQIRVAYYEPDRRQLAVATLTDPDAFAGAGWDTEFISDGGFDEGQDPSGATAPDGTLAVAYYRCAGVSRGGTDCDDDDDALVVALQAPGESEWTIEVVDEGVDGGRCGTQPSAAFDGDGALWVGYICQDVDGARVEDRVHVAEREPFE